MLDQVGRRLSLSFGCSLAVIGAAISALSIFNNNFIGFIFGAMLLGMARASGDQSRYVAAEVYPLARRARIIGLIVFAGTIGAVLGRVSCRLVVPGWQHAASLNTLARLSSPDC